MIKSYLLLAIGNFRKNKLAIGVNVTGLAFSIAAVIAISFFIRRETMYDRHHDAFERIFRITEVLNSGSYVENSSSLPVPMGPALADEYPEMIEEMVRIFDFQVPTKAVKLENEDFFNEEFIYYADSNFFRVFSLPLVSGLPDEVLNKPNTMVISEELAEKWFGDNNPVGRTIMLPAIDNFRVSITGVFANIKPSHFRPQAIISMSSILNIAKGLKKNWVWNPAWTYVKLKPGVDISNLTEQFPAFVKKHTLPALQGMTTLQSQPIASIHLDSHLEFEMMQNSDRKFIFIFSCCALFLMIVALVNFVNLTTVTLSSRSKETGVRKTSGGTYGQLVSQFVAESILLSLISFLFGILLLLICRPILQDLFAFEFRVSDALDPVLILPILLFVFLTGVIGGLYPAHILSRLSIVSLFKKEIKTSKAGKNFRKILVVIQFGIAVVLIVFTLIAGKQFRFMQQKNKGYDTDNVITMYVGGTSLPLKIDEFRNELLSNSAVQSVSIMNEIIGVTNNNHEFRFGDLTGDEFRYIPALVVDEHFVNTMNMKIIAGRNYDPNIKLEDSLSVVVNRSLAKYLGFNNPEDAIGQRFSSLSGDEYIIGVTEDFNTKSMHNAIGPFVLDIESRNLGNYYQFVKYLVVKMNGITPEGLQHLKNCWEKHVTTKPFDYTLLDNHHANMYKQESAMNKVLSIFSILAIVIACSGLFALTRVLATAKAKELAIRKVMGAGMFDLMYAATKEQMVTIVLSLFPAIPVGYFLITKWLETFAFRVDQDIYSYLAAVFIALAVAVLTIIQIAINVAGKNPAPLLRSE